MLTDTAIRILAEERNLDPELLARHGWSSIENHAGGDWIAIPYMVGSDIVNHKYRSISGEKRFHQETGARKCFWNLNALLDSTLGAEPLVITEGEIDAMTAIQCGFIRTISVPDGAPAEAMGDRDGAKYSFVTDAQSALSNCSEIILATDGDGPGMNLLNDLALRLGKPRCKWIKYPIRSNGQGRCKDLNEVLITYGERGVIECLRRADWMKTDGVYAMDDLPPVIEQPVLTIGFPVLDNHVRVRRGDFWVVTGIPSHGKSTFLNDLACRMALNHNWRIAFASFEQQPQTDHRRNLRSWHARKHKTWLTPQDEISADAWISGRFRFIVPSEDDSPNLEWMLEKCAMAVIQHECQMIVIDPWNEMEHNRGDLSLTEYVGFAIKQFKKFAKKYNITLVIAAHPTKMRRENGGYLPPSLWDISDSANWANKADVGITVFRPDPSQNQTQIIVTKIRFQDQIGSPGTVNVCFLGDQRRYEAVDTNLAYMEVEI